MRRCRAVLAAVWLTFGTPAPGATAVPRTPAQLDRALAAGKTAFERNDFAGAIALWRDAIVVLQRTKDKRAGDLLFLIGFAYRGTGNSAQALTSFRAALAVHRALGNRARESGDLSSIGGVEERLGRNGDALDSYRAALAIDSSSNDAADSADDLGHIGKLERLLARNDDARRDLERALIIDRASADKPSEATHLGELGNVLNAQGRYDDALAAQQQALALHRALKDRSGEATDLGNVANAQENLARYDDALALDRRALELDRALGSRRGEASDLGNIGNLERDLGHYDEALARHAEALALHHALGDRLEEAADLLNIGGVDEELGRYDDGLAALRRAEAIDRDAADSLGQAHALADIGTIEEQLGAYADARAALGRALALHRAARDRLGEANDLGNIGNLDADLGRYADALTAYQQSLAIDRALGNRLGEAADLLDIGNVEENLGRASDGLASFEQALAIHRAIGSTLGEADGLGNLATVDDVLERYTEARDAARQAIELDTKLATPEGQWHALAAAAYADAHLGNRADALGEYDGALERIEALRAGLGDGERAGFFADKLFVYDEYVAYLMELDAAFPGKGYDRKALEILERKSARALLEQIGQSAAHHFREVDAGVIAGEDAAQGEIERTEGVRTKLLAARGTDPALLANADRDVTAAQAAAATLAASIASRYPAYYALRHPRPLVASCAQTPCSTIASFQQSVLQAGETALVYDLLDARGALWVIERDRVQLIPLAGRAEIDTAVARLSAHVAGMLVPGQSASRLERSAANDIPAFAADSYALYRLLLPGGAATAVARAKSLIVVPSGSLYRLAFETLVSRDPAAAPLPHYLLEDAPVSYIPSLSLLALERGSYAQPSAGRSPLLAFANPAFGGGAVAGAETRGLGGYARLQLAAARSAFRSGAAVTAGAGFPPLPGTQVEAEAVRGALGAAPESVVSAGEASRAHLLALNDGGQLKTYQYLLFATHAVLPSEIKGLTQPAIVLAHPERGDGLLTMSDVFGLALDADFVALSACNTGVATADSAGEGISGLTRAFLYAGTPAISVTLWEVDDAVAPQITPPFFAAMYGSKTSPAAALRAAKLALLASPQARFRHPYAWGPSVIFGDGSHAVMVQDRTSPRGY
jgi:CHAT domain-containing protein/tetratricopeptide (TPR) repeat protein